MVNKNNCLKISAIAFFFGFIAVGCLTAQTDSRLNGMWVSGQEEEKMELRLNNGNYEVSAMGMVVYKGTYTTKNGEINFNTTHVFGYFFKAMDISGFDQSKWYSKNEFIIAIRPTFVGIGLSDREINEYSNALIFDLPSSKYSVDSSTFIIFFEVGPPMIFKKIKSQ